MQAQIIHQTQPLEALGEPLATADALMIMIHGRGGGTRSITALTSHIKRGGFAYLAPQAAHNTWYPQRFIAPRQSNEPYLSSALATVDDLVQQALDAGLPSHKIMLLGFSQGACLAGEYAARFPRRYGGVVMLSGGLIGAEGELTGYEGTLDGTPVFLGCSDVDFHIPVERVHESATIFETLGAQVDKRIYPDMGHNINTDEVEAVKLMMANVMQSDN